MLHLRFLLRELVSAKKQASVFVLCVALSISTLVALNSFKNNVYRSIAGDARTLLGGDILLHSHYEFTQALSETVSDLERKGSARGVRIYELYSVIRSATSERTLFSRLKAVESGYPLYGRVELQSGRPFSQVLGAGQVVVEQEVLDRLNLRIGDHVHIGSAVLTIADIVTHEPDRPVEIFALGPRVFVSTQDLERLELIGKSSRVEYGILLKINGDDAMINASASRLALSVQSGQERVSTYRTAGSGVKRFFDNLFFFLSLVSTFTLFLAGIGMQTSLAALLREKEKTLAVIKALGAPGRFLFRHYFSLVLFLGLAGSLIGIAAGLVIEHLLPPLFAGLLPVGTDLSISIANSGEGLLTGLLVVVFFTFLPLYSLHSIKPMAIFRNDTTPPENRGIIFYLVVLGGFLMLSVLVIRQLQDLKIGLYFMAGSSALIVCISLLTRIILAVSQKVPIAGLVLRQAQKSLFRPGNATRSIVVTLASALSVLLTIYLVQTNLSTTYIESYPADAPNLFFLDIQTDQKDAFTREIGSTVELFPVIRARLVTMNGKPVKEGKEQKQRGDSLTREFNLTYRNTLLADEVIRNGNALFRKDTTGRIPLQVSVLDTVAEMGDMHINDSLEFNIQGVVLQAQITSIRTRTKSRLYPFFYFVFPEEFLHDAPQTSFAALHVDRDAIAGLENRIVSNFPNISFINMAETATQLGGLTRRLTNIVNFFAGFSILAGALIMVGSIFATRLARIREAVYYKILGGSSRFVLSVFMYEHMILGLFSSFLAVILAQAGSWGLCRYLFDIGYSPHWPVCLVLILMTGSLVITVGLLSSIGIIRQKPAIVLREQSGG